jgi:hypothetical protein
LIGIDADWKWINENIMNEVTTLDDVHDRESFAVAKFFSMVQNQDTNTDEKSTDAKFRQAARSWRQIFHIPETERLVNCVI